jgi:tetratricopeptide (TPR) repeat protein
MLKRLCVVAGMAMLAVTAGADYVADRQAALALVNAGKHEEALAAFTNMAGGKVSDFQKSDALEQAALCVVGLRQFDRAMELALQIPQSPVSKMVQMKVLSNQSKSLDLVAKFKEENIDAWPDWIKADAFFSRGLAASYAKDGALAEADLKKAVFWATDDNVKGEACNALGDMYRSVLKDDARAIETYRSNYQCRNEFKRARAAMCVADIYVAQKKYDEALKELQTIKMADMHGSAHWHASALIAYAQTYAASGRKAEAIASFKEALHIDGLPAYQKAECDKGLKDLDGGAPPTE